MFKHRVMRPNGADRMANRVDPDQTAPSESDLDLHCLPKPDCPKTQNHYSNWLLNIAV